MPSYGDFNVFANMAPLNGFQAFDVVVTCFFIDTAANILDYLLSIRKLLVEGGIWINMGPLQVLCVV